MASLMPEGKQRYTNNSGAPLSGGKVFTFAEGTTTPKATYSDQAGTVPNANPVILNTRGEALIFWSGNYRVVVKDAQDNIIYTIDKYRSIDPKQKDDVLIELAKPTGADALGFKPSIIANSVAQTLGQFCSRTIKLSMFGAYGKDGTVDETTQIQLAIYYCCTINGMQLDFDGFKYLISDELLIPFSTGWKFSGLSRAGTTIVQATDNKPIFRFTAALTHSWTINSMTLGYVTKQPATNTMAQCVYFAADTGSGPNGIFNFQIRDMAFFNGFRGIASKATGGQLSIWGAHITDCAFNGSMTGAGIHFVPYPAVGQPNINLGSLYFDCASATELSLAVNYCENLLLSSIEFNGGSGYGAGKTQMRCNTCQTISIQSCKSEKASISDDGVLWQFDNSKVTVNGISFKSLSVAAGKKSRLIEAPTGGKLIINCMDASADFIGSLASITMVSGDGIISLAGVDAGTGISRYVDYFGVPSLDLDTLQKNNLGQFGDVSVVLTIASPRVVYFGTALTADRDVSLPSTGVTAGLEFTVVRWGGGLFLLRVIDALSGKTLVIPSGKKGSISYRAISSYEWVPISYSIFP